jgi:hypothetical protein
LLRIPILEKQLEDTRTQLQKSRADLETNNANLETCRINLKTTQADLLQIPVLEKQLEQTRTRLQTMQAELELSNLQNRFNYRPTPWVPPRTLLTEYKNATGQDQLCAIASIVRRRHEFFGIQREIVQRIITRGRELLQNVNTEALWQIIWLSEKLNPQ